VPADTSDLDGSLGDQALLLGLSTLIDWKAACIVVSERFVTSKVFVDKQFLRAWDGVLAGWKLGRAVNQVTSLFIIGADVMDGYYSPVVSNQRIALVDVLARHGIQTVFTGFSFNEHPSKSVVNAFRCLPNSVHICLRDEVSLLRFETLVGRKATLVSDLAFLMPPETNSIVSKRLTEWAVKQRNAGRQVLGINVNPQVVAHLKYGSEVAIASSVAECCRDLLRQNVGIALIPHDFRPGCADLRVLSMVLDVLGSEDTSNVILLADAFTAPAIKAACVPFDLILSARMHLAIGALSVGTPVCGMQYQGKFEGLFRHFDFGPDIFIAPEIALDAQQLTRFILAHLAQAESHRRNLVTKLPSVVELARKNVAQPTN
jgi:polysaccharide pyruvyl transferase WcaK-like protein